ncbi:head GIN domain-containing protein [Algoriphagus terrigena]|uniref:head GIN domain-containing protein n=1 Tax=Algoriphagus terrigena TaxID=344884 RepID=UPI000412C6A2|nr:head GIN domain-containing protein [Algoriphagus terrigena]
MKNYFKIAAFALSAFALASCVQAQQTETRTPGSFTKVHSGGSWDVILVEGDKEEIKIEAKGVSLEEVRTEIEGDVLQLGLVKGNYNNVSLKFYVTYKTLEGVKCSGSGKMTVKSDVTADEFYIGLSGSGDIIMQGLRADDLEASISGSAKVTIDSGSVGDAEIKQSGSGDFEAENLSIEELNVSKSGSGGTYVGDLGMVSLHASGSGDVVYSGSPRMGEIKVSGSSSIRKR